ncbi:flagellar motor switch protein FliM [Vibrio sp. HA2012]|uniref:FliM/FliN family flagellar motor switch protein n=1 Tax=Vibrio sp. HA2012 TaxID=1971595 RepID=UPI000C2BE19D|nr:flagellar motor switch protein FliM [Vibrio sp. HA2012]PJC86438.1 flagellar motor switch protein FliM [Vibrio sp. HA2012]
MKLSTKLDANITNIDIELLGKPINAIKDELHDILFKATLDITHTLRTWLKEPAIKILFSGMTIQVSDKKEYSLKSAVLRHTDGGLLRTHMPSALLMRLSDCFYSADVVRKPSDDSTQEDPLTSSDLRLQHRIAKLIASYIAPEDMWYQIDAITGRDISLRAEFTISLKDFSGVLCLDLDSSLVQTLIDELDLSPSKALKEKFAKALVDTPVKLNTVLCRKTLSLDEVLKLRPNDIINIDLLSSMPVSIGKERLFNGHIAEQNGQLVLILKD